MKQPEVRDPSVMIAVLFGIEGVEVLGFVEDEESEDGAFGVMFELPDFEARCPTCRGEVLEEERIVYELPPTTAGPAPVLLAWSRRHWSCVDRTCTQEIFDEESTDIENFIARVAPNQRSKKLRHLDVKWR